MDAIRIDTSRTKAVIFDMNGTMVVGESASNLQEVAGLRRLVHLLGSHGVLLAIATRASRAECEQVLRQIELEEKFKLLLTTEDVRHPKPHPEIYQLALKKLAISAEEALVFEDTPSGIMAAKTAGIPVVGIIGFYEANQLMESGALACLSDFRPIALT